MLAFLLLFPAYALPPRADTLTTPSDNAAALTAEHQVAAEPMPSEDVMPLRLRADSQRFTQDTFEAEGNVELSFGAATLRADRLVVDLQAQTVTATDNIEIELGLQRLQGDHLAYDLTTETGELLNARGRLDIANTVELTATETTEASLVRFTAERISLTPEGWVGEQVRITNDPLDPPELEIETERTTVTILPTGEAVAIASGANLVFDQRFRLPSFVNRLRLDTLGRRPPLTLDFDSRDGGLQVQQNFELLEAPRFSLVLSPKLIPQRLIGDPDGILAGLGVDFEFQVQHLNNHLSRLFIEVNGLILNQLDERTRGVLSHQIPLGENLGSLTLSYRYRQRFGTEFTGTQTVRHMTGLSYDSPRWELGSSEIFATVNASANWITARGETIITPNPTAAFADASPEISLGRLRLDASLSRRFPLWLGNPVTDLSLLRYSPEPVQPGVWLNTGVTASHAGYTDGKTQSYLVGSIGLETVLGNFINDSFDFTQFQVTYSNGLLSGASPFFFDRLAASERLRVGIVQQLYGPIRIGAETVIDLRTSRRLDTTYSLSYDRRTYGVLLRYNPIQEAGSVQLRVSDFNWTDTEGISRGANLRNEFN